MFAVAIQHDRTSTVRISDPPSGRTVTDADVIAAHSDPPPSNPVTLSRTTTGFWDSSADVILTSFSRVSSFQGNNSPDPVARTEQICASIDLPEPAAGASITASGVGPAMMFLQIGNSIMAIAFALEHCVSNGKS